MMPWPCNSMKLISRFVQRKKWDTRNVDVSLGSWALGGKSLRPYPYSTDLGINPLLFSHFSKYNEIHDLGTIWASLLNEMYWNLVDAYGFSKDIFDSKQTAGNIVAIQLMIGGMMFQPCNPNYVQAFNAILLADHNYYNGEHICEIWKAFAKRGMGLDAVMHVDGYKTKYIDGFQVPSRCY